MDKDGLLVGLGVVGAIGAMAVLMMSVGECSDRRRQAARENERSVDQHKARSAAPTYRITMPLEEVDLYLGAGLGAQTRRCRPPKNARVVGTWRATVPASLAPLTVGQLQGEPMAVAA